MSTEKSIAILRICNYCYIRKKKEVSGNLIHIFSRYKLNYKIASMQLKLFACPEQRDINIKKYRKYCRVDK
jgi:hypothetical protein